MITNSNKEQKKETLKLAVINHVTIDTLPPSSGWATLPFQTEDMGGGGGLMYNRG